MNMILKIVRKHRIFTSLAVLGLGALLAWKFNSQEPSATLKPLFNGAENPYADADISSSPNILLIVADDLGYSDIGAYGGEIATPNIDRLARRGISMTNFYASPTCAPTRAMLLTGVDNHRAGLGSMVVFADNQKGKPGYEDRLNDRVVTIARLLGDAGYSTLMSGKWHLGFKSGQRPSDRGFQQSFSLLQAFSTHYKESGFRKSHYYKNDREVEIPDNFYSSDFYTDQLIEQISQTRTKKEPFFAYAAYTAPHWPLQAPEKLVQNYLAKYQVGWDQVRASRFKKMKQLNLIPADLDYPPRLEGIPAWQSLPDHEKRNQVRKMATYAAMVENLDQNIGRLVSALEVSGELDNTLIVFMSDNGADPLVPEESDVMMFRMLTLGKDNEYDNIGKKGSFITYGPGWASVGSNHLSYGKGLVSEGGVRVPMIVSYPKLFMTGAKLNETSSVMDIAPTLLELSNLEPPSKSYRGQSVEPMNGDSLLAYLTGKTSAIARAKKYLGFELWGHQALIEGEWKIQNLKPPHGTGQWQLFNLAEDPSELRDLAAHDPNRLGQMLELYEDYKRDNGVIIAPAEHQGLAEVSVFALFKIARKSRP